MWHVDLDNPPDEARPYLELYEMALQRIKLLEARRDELLALVAKLSQEVPLQSEVGEALQQRGVLLAEVGTLKARIQDLERDRSDFDLQPTSRTELLFWPGPDEPSVECSHSNRTATIINGQLVGQNCMNCWLPIGIPCDPEPANDSFSFVEVMAAELAANWVDGNRGGLLNDDAIGWNAWHDNHDFTDSNADSYIGWNAGWLAACIIGNPQ